MLKKLSCAIVCVLLSSVFYAQSANSKETTVEDEYLSSVEDVIITELATSDDYDNKNLALSYLENAIKEGRQSPDMIASLDRLAGEGLTNISRTNGRVMNNYPDVRAKACDLLGSLPTEQAKNTLVSIALDDKEPMVVTAAIRSLGNIGINNNDEVVQMIEFVHKKYAALNPTSSLALEILTAYEKLAPNVQDKNAMIQSIAEIATNYKYATTVREKAKRLIKDLSAGSSSNNAR